MAYPIVVLIAIALTAVISYIISYDPKAEWKKYERERMKADLNSGRWEIDVLWKEIRKLRSQMTELQHPYKFEIGDCVTHNMGVSTVSKTGMVIERKRNSDNTPIYIVKNNDDSKVTAPEDKLKLSNRKCKC